MKRCLLLLTFSGMIAIMVGVRSADPAFAAGVVDIHVGSFYFEDATVGDGVINANVGDQLRFIFDDNGAHTADVDALGIHTGPQDKGATFVTAQLTSPGSYELYCTPHRRRGHVATLIVSGGPTTTTTTTTSTTTTTTTSTTAPTSTSTTSTTGSSTTGSTTSTTQASTTTTSGATSTAPPDTATTTAGQTTASSASSPEAVTASSRDTAQSTDVQAADSATEITSSEVDPASADPPGAGEPDASSTGSDSGSTPASTDDSIESSSGLLPVGVTEPDGKPWLRSVWVGLVSLVPISGTAVLAGVRARRNAPELN